MLRDNSRRADFLEFWSLAGFGSIERMQVGIGDNIMTTDYFETKLSVLMKEWDYCQTHIGRLDTIIFVIRGWAVTAASAILALAVTQASPILALFGIVPALMFWLIDAINRTFQRRFLVRAIAIEAYFRFDDFRLDLENSTFQRFLSPFSFESFILRMSRWKQFKVVAREAIRPSVAAVYGSIILLCLISGALIGFHVLLGVVTLLFSSVGRVIEKWFS